MCLLAVWGGGVLCCCRCRRWEQGAAAAGSVRGGGGGGGDDDARRCTRRTRSSSRRHTRVTKLCAWLRCPARRRPPLALRSGFCVSGREKMAPPALLLLCSSILTPSPFSSHRPIDGCDCELRTCIGRAASAWVSGTAMTMGVVLVRDGSKNGVTLALTLLAHC